jgi:prepilin-type N-terminal cleavage/methylation domain-containing protein
MNRQADGRRRGFSIIELMIALAIFVTSFCMIIGVFPMTFKSIQTSKNSLIAGNIATERMERIKDPLLRKFNVVSEYGTTDEHFFDIVDTIYATEAQNVIQDPSPVTFTSMVNGVTQQLDYTVMGMVEPLEPPDPDMVLVTVRVQWNEGSRNCEVKLVSKIARLQ